MVRKRRKRGYVHLNDGDWIEMARRGNRIACCGCGLVHAVDFRVIGGRLLMRFALDRRATAAARRRFRR